MQESPNATRCIRMLRYLTAGESHGPALDRDRRRGFRRASRSTRSRSTASWSAARAGTAAASGRSWRPTGSSSSRASYHGVTTGGPITLRLINNDAKLERLAEPAAPRGGHIDLAGAINYQTGIRQVLERASARETALRVAVGALARLLLARAGDHGLWLRARARRNRRAARCVRPGGPRRQPGLHARTPQADPAIVAAIDAAREAGDTLGGIVETIVTGCPIGLGSHAQWDRKLDARLAAAVMSIQAIKAVEIGLGVEAARRPGSKVMDPIAYEPDHPTDDRRFGFRRPTNNAGGIEGGTSNGEPIVVRAAKKPISTLAARGPSVNMATKAAPARRLRTLRRLRRAGRQRDRRERRRLRDRRGRRREIRRHQPRGDPDGH